MKFFALALLLIIAVCGYFRYTDGPDSGMGYATGFFAVLLAAVLLYTKVKTGSFLSDSSAGR